MRYKYRGSSGKVNLALSGLPELACKPGVGEWLARRDLLLAVARLHGARLRRREVRPSVGPPLHRLHHADARRPHDGASRQARDELLRAVRARITWRTASSGTTQKREAFGQNVIDTLEERFPNIRNLIEGHQFVTPKDIEDITGLTEGNIFAGRALPRAAVLQPAGAGWARYETPVKDLWMCGSATHPGGGIMGAPGTISALEYLKQASADGGRVDGAALMAEEVDAIDWSSSAGDTTGSSRPPYLAKAGSEGHRARGGIRGRRRAAQLDRRRGLHRAGHHPHRRAACVRPWSRT